MESDSLAEMQDLDRKLKLGLLDERTMAGLLSYAEALPAHKPDVEGALVTTDSSDTSTLLFDSGKFRVLYHNWDVVDHKRNWYLKKIPKTLEGELVVRAEINELQALENHLNYANLVVIEAQESPQAIFQLTIASMDTLILHHYKKSLETLAEQRYTVSTFLELQEKIPITYQKKWSDQTTTRIINRLLGHITGPSEEVLEIRKFVKKQGVKVQLVNEGLVFSDQIYK